jgi:hypothetical protein
MTDTPQRPHPGDQQSLVNVQPDAAGQRRTQPTLDRWFTLDSAGGDDFRFREIAQGTEDARRYHARLDAWRNEREKLRNKVIRRARAIEGQKRRRQRRVEEEFTELCGRPLPADELAAISLAHEFSVVWTGDLHELLAGVNGRLRAARRRDAEVSSAGTAAEAEASPPCARAAERPSRADALCAVELAILRVLSGRCLMAREIVTALVVEDERQRDALSPEAQHMYTAVRRSYAQVRRYLRRLEAADLVHRPNGRTGGFELTRANESKVQKTGQ